MPLKRWDPISFMLHILLALSIIIQLATSQFMTAPHGILFQYHIVFGFTALVSVLLILLWKLIGPNGGMHYLFPWGKSGRKDIADDIKTLIQRQLPNRIKGGLPGLIQGLGLLLMLAMGLLGGSWYLLIHYAPPSWGINPYFLIEWHSFLATFVWIYLGGHAGMALLHFVVEKCNRSQAPLKNQ